MICMTGPAVDEVTASGLKESLLMVKGHKYCPDMSREELTAAKRLFSPTRSCMSSVKASFLEGKWKFILPQRAPSEPLTV